MRLIRAICARECWDINRKFQSAKICGNPIYFPLIAHIKEDIIVGKMHQRGWRRSEPEVAMRIILGNQLNSLFYRTLICDICAREILKYHQGVSICEICGKQNILVPLSLKYAVPAGKLSSS